MSLDRARADLKLQIAKLEAEASQLKQALALLNGDRPGGQKPVGGRKRTRKPLTAAGRKRIREAQKKRWAAFRAKKAKASKT
jgi:hypothetical protein